MLGSAIAHEVCRNVRLAKVDQPVAAVNTKMTMVMVNNNGVNHDDGNGGDDVRLAKVDRQVTEVNIRRALMGWFKIMMMVMISINVGWRQLGIFRGDLDDNDNRNDHFEGGC